MDLSSIALSLSVLSLGASLYVLRQNRGLSATASACMDSNEPLGYRIDLYVVNLGRQPLSLRTLSIKFRDGATASQPLLDPQGQPIKLAQSEFHELVLAQHNSALTEWAKSPIESVKIVDSYDRAWEVKDFANIINRYHHRRSEKSAAVSAAS